MSNLKKRKNKLLDSLKQQGFEEKIVKAFEKVKREEFVPNNQKGLSYEDTPLPIGQGQTISQPSTIAFMLSLLEVENNQKILEVGSGSGYVLALLSQINNSGQITGVERIEELFLQSRENLKKYKNIQVFKAEKTFGLKKHSPYDRILVSASAQEIPQELVDQLKTGGILVMPVQESIIQLRKGKKSNTIKEIPGFVFVPLVKS